MESCRSKHLTVPSTRGHRTRTDDTRTAHGEAFALVGEEAILIAGADRIAEELEAPGVRVWRSHSQCFA